MPLYRAELLAKKPLRYAALIHDLSQVLYLPFDYDDGSYARDRSGYNNHGTIRGATKADGKIGTARSFDGTDDYVECPTLDLVAPLTVQAWFLTRTIASGRSVVVSEGRDYYGSGWILWRADNYIQFTWDEDGLDNGREKTLSASISPNVWYHVAAVHTGNEGRLYLNGNLVDSVSALQIVHKYSLPVRIGMLAWSTGFFPFDGVIDEVRIYNRALSRDEIRMLMYRSV